MHKVKLMPNKKDNIKEIKEECYNPVCKGNSLWVYSEKSGPVVCNDCKTHLRGKQLLNYQQHRVNYHFEEAS